MILYEVAVAAPVPDTLTYGIPEDGYEPVLDIGCCVTVPLGKRRRVTGYVMGVAREPASATPSYNIKPISEVLYSYPLFGVELAGLFRWIAAYYHAPIGEVIRTALSAVSLPKRGYRVRIVEPDNNDLIRSRLGELDPSSIPWVEELCRKGELSTATVDSIRKDSRQNRTLDQLIEQGMASLTHETLKSASGGKKESDYNPSEALIDILKGRQGCQSPTPQSWESYGWKLKPSEKKALTIFLELYFSCGHRPVPRKRIIDREKRHGPALLSLVKKGILIKGERRVYRNPFGEPLESGSHTDGIQLTPEQQNVLMHLLPHVEHGGFKPFLLRGVTGCGKTEVYLRAAEAAVTQGKTALVLVPEIALASQLEAQFFVRFGDKLALMHSGMSKGERLDQHHRIVTGDARVVLGARSAVFAPLSDLGVIIVDEEHESSYKQDDGVRYHGRDVAVKRAQMAGCPVLLGSATPSITSFANTKNGKYTLLTMNSRVEQRPLPLVEVVDLSQRGTRRGSRYFSEALVNDIRRTVEAKHQVLLFVNRRGFSSCMLCLDCGHVLQCRHCMVSLTYHRSRNRLLCHYCGYTLTHDVLCPACSSDRIEGVGLGVERVEQEVHELFPGVRVARLDSDVASKRKDYLDTLKAVRNREIDILVGTQMIAKGLHFPGITLVGVVWADAGLAMPEYKAAERTFALLSQVTGRAGRGDEPGKVIIQTHQPHHYAIQLAQSHDYDSMFEQENRNRKLLGFPPFGRLVNLKFSGLDEKLVEGSARRTLRCLEKLNHAQKVEILGPVPSPLAKIKDRYRWQILLKTADIAELHRICHQLLEERNRIVDSAVRLGVDVDPENMM